MNAVVQKLMERESAQVTRHLQQLSPEDRVPERQCPAPGAFPLLHWLAIMRGAWRLPRES